MDAFQHSVTSEEVQILVHWVREGSLTLADHGLLVFFFYNRKIQADRWPAQIEAIAENRFAPQFVHNLHSQRCSTSKIEPLFKIPENLLVLLDNIAPLLKLEKFCWACQIPWCGPWVTSVHVQ